MSAATQALIDRSIEPSTRKQYERAEAKFRTWLRDVREVDDTDLPMPEDVIEFFAEMGVELSWTSETAEKHKSGISFCYKAKGLPDPCAGDPRLPLVLRALGKMKPAKEKLQMFSPTKLIELWQTLPANEELTKTTLLGKLTGMAELMGTRMGDLITLKKENILPVEGEGQEHNLQLRLLTKEGRKRLWAIRHLWGNPDDEKLCFHCALTEYVKRVPENAEHIIFWNPFAKRVLSARTLAIACDKQLRAAQLPEAAHTHSLRGIGATTYRDILLGAESAVKGQFGWAPRSTVPNRHYLKQTPELAKFMSEAIMKVEHSA